MHLEYIIPQITNNIKYVKRYERKCFELTISGGKEACWIQLYPPNYEEYNGYEPIAAQLAIFFKDRMPE